MKWFLIGQNDNARSVFETAAAAGLPPALVLVFRKRDDGEMRKLCERFGVRADVVDDANDHASELAPLHFDVLVSVGYEKKILAPLRAAVRLGALNVHTSLLPHYRGYHPISWAMINGDERIGSTVHIMTDDYDAGDIVLQGGFDVSVVDDINSVRAKLMALNGDLLVEVLRGLARGELPRTPQDHALATPAPRRRPEDSRLDWRWSAARVVNFCRALYAPYPNAFSRRGERTVRVTRVRVSAVPGEVLARTTDGWYVVATADGTVCVELDDDVSVGDVLG